MLIEKTKWRTAQRKAGRAEETLWFSSQGEVNVSSRPSCVLCKYISFLTDTYDAIARLTALFEVRHRLHNRPFISPVRSVNSAHSRVLLRQNRVNELLSIPI